MRTNERTSRERRDGRRDENIVFCASEYMRLRRYYTLWMRVDTRSYTKHRHTHTHTNPTSILFNIFSFWFRIDRRLHLYSFFFVFVSVASPFSVFHVLHFRQIIMEKGHSAKSSEEQKGLQMQCAGSFFFFSVRFAVSFGRDLRVCRRLLARGNRGTEWNWIRRLKFYEEGIVVTLRNRRWKTKDKRRDRKPLIISSII